MKLERVTIEWADGQVYVLNSAEISEIELQETEYGAELRLVAKVQGDMQVERIPARKPAKRKGKAD